MSASIQSVKVMDSILMFSSGRSFLSHFARSMACTMSAPLTTRPNTVCLLSSHGVATVVMKNCRGGRATQGGCRG